MHETIKGKCGSVSIWTALLATAALSPALAQTASYEAVDNIEEDWVNLNLPPVRPMMLWGGLELYAVNVHDSTVSRFNSATSLPMSTFRTPWGPVSIAGWVDPFGGASSEKLLVACRGSYVLAFLDRITGRTIDILELPAEPGDLLVDQTSNQAYITCSAQDLVVEVDLVGVVITRQWTIPSKHPLFMSFDQNNDIVVAPMLSGNNSAAERAPGTFIPLDSGPRGILDLANPAVATPPGLPDQDLFRILRGPGTVLPQATAMGAVLFNVAHNPATNTFWQLGTEANNKDPARQTEPSINGESVRNVLSIVTDNPVGAPHPPLNVINLDDSNPTTPGVQIDPTRTVGQPYGLAIEPVTGFGFISGMLTDNVTLLDSAGAFVLEWDVPRGSIPRAVMYSQGLNLVFVYCWGTNKVESYFLGAPPVPFVSFDLGHDPTPELIKRGRQVYYSAFKSRDNNASCNSCHIDGKADNLPWNLSNENKDNKGPMFTQLLSGIDRLPPFHWRGERDGLIFFNEAFVGLMGARTPLSERPGGEFDQFEAFVMSLRNPANPNANETRVVDGTIQGPTFPSYPSGNAVTGQGLFKANPALDCEPCHSFPMGTSNEVVGDDALTNNNPRRQRFKVPPFHEIYRKETDADPLTPGIQTVPVTLVGGSTVNFSATGAGFAHSSVFTNLHHFNQIFEHPGLATPLSQAQAADLISFMWQWDNGMGLAVHRAFMLRQGTVAAVRPRLNYLFAQALQRNCDIAVYGSSFIGSATRQVDWTFNRATLLFDADDTTLASQPLSFFLGQATAGTGTNVFVGVPVGSGERFGVDYDADDLFNGDEAVQTSNPYVKDTDSDRFWDGHEVKNAGNPVSAGMVSNDITAPTVTDVRTQWFTQRVATLTLFTNEPTAVTATYQLNGGPAQTLSENSHRKVHRLVLTDLLPSTGGSITVNNTYSGTIKVTDLAGLSTTVPIPAPVNSFFTLLPNFAPPITTREFTDDETVLVAGDLRWQTVTVNSAAGTLQGTAEIRVDRKVGRPIVNQVQGAVAIFRVLRNGQPAAFTSSGAQTFSVGGTLYAATSPLFPRALSGPFLVSSLTDVNGLATASFSASGYSPGDTLTLNLEFIAIPTASHSSANPDVQNIRQWSMPESRSFNFPGNCRGLSITF